MSEMESKASCMCASEEGATTKPPEGSDLHENPDVVWVKGFIEEYAVTIEEEKLEALLGRITSEGFMFLIVDDRKQLRRDFGHGIFLLILAAELRVVDAVNNITLAEKQAALASAIEEKEIAETEFQKRIDALVASSKLPLTILLHGNSTQGNVPRFLKKSFKLGWASCLAIRYGKPVGWLGIGASGSVYKVKRYGAKEDEEPVCAKVYSRRACATSEKEALQRLAKELPPEVADHVPVIEAVEGFDVQLLEVLGERTDPWVVIMKPVGENWDHRLKYQGYEQDIRPFLMMMYEVARSGLVHRDVRPDNIIVHKNKMLLIDWACAVENGEHGFAGSDRFGSIDAFETQTTKEKYKYDFKEDLIGIIHTVFVVASKEHQKNMRNRTASDAHAYIEENLPKCAPLFNLRTEVLGASEHSRDLYSVVGNTLHDYLLAKCPPKET